MLLKIRKIIQRKELLAKIVKIMLKRIHFNYSLSATNNAN